jgi:hypothetical protein
MTSVAPVRVSHLGRPLGPAVSPRLARTLAVGMTLLFALGASAVPLLGGSTSRCAGKRQWLYTAVDSIRAQQARHHEQTGGFARSLEELEPPPHRFGVFPHHRIRMTASAHSWTVVGEGIGSMAGDLFVSTERGWGEVHDVCWPEVLDVL